MSSGKKTAAELIQLAKTNPPVPIIQGLLNEKEIVLVHAYEESFKSFLTTQLGDALARGIPFLRVFKVMKGYRVGIIQTEMHEAQLGERLGKMYPDGVEPPAALMFMDEDGLRNLRKAKTIDQKMKVIHQWTLTHGIDALIVDPAGDLLREQHTPSDETTVGRMFEEFRNMALKGVVLVRHDRKAKMEDALANSSNDKIRGSSEWKEDPEIILYMHRQDKRTHQVTLDVGKIRYGQKPETMALFFDAGTSMLTPLPPVIALLEKGPLKKSVLKEEARKRFGIKERTLDESLNVHLNKWLQAKLDGHEKIWSINLSQVKETVKLEEEPPLWCKALLSAGQ